MEMLLGLPANSRFLVGSSWFASLRVWPMGQYKFWSSRLMKVRGQICPRIHDSFEFTVLHFQVDQEKDMDNNNGGDDEFGANPGDKLLKGSELRGLKRNKRSKKPMNGSKWNLRHENRIRLLNLLQRLVRQRNWEDAGGVLAVLLKGTCEDRSVHNNRLKYSVAMELLGYVQAPNASSSKDTFDIYDLWMKKIAAPKNKPVKDKFVLFDSIVTFLVLKDYDKARLCAFSLMQDSKTPDDPISNLILGLCYYELWYATLPADRKLIHIHDVEMLDETEESGTNLVKDSESYLHGIVEDTEESGTELHYVAQDSENYLDCIVQDTISSSNYHSRTSNMNEKVIQMDNLDQKDRNLSQVKGLYTNSYQSIASEEGSLMNRNFSTQCSSALYSHGVPDSLLFPIQWDPLNENIENVIEILHPNQNDDYDTAVKYLRKAVNSAPGVEEALLPLMQMLWLNGRVEEALHELEKFFYASKSLFASRLKSHCLKCLGCNDEELAISFYEEMLKNDPTCKDALTRLVRAHQTGGYKGGRLVKMIALHLDATFGEHGVWKEFASCLLQVNQCEEDRGSTCRNVEERENQNKKPSSVSSVKDLLGELRCRCWLNRHFNNKLLAREMEGGKLSLMAYKAACAYQIYGGGFDYVVKVAAILKQREDPLLFTLLNTYCEY